MIGIARACSSRPPWCRDGRGGREAAAHRPVADGEGQERPHQPAWGFSGAPAPALSRRRWGCELGVAGARHE